MRAEPGRAPGGRATRVGRVTTSASSAVEPPTYALENELSGNGAALIAGIDEVGRGAWAGPVVVCAAVTDGSDPPEG